MIQVRKLEPKDLPFLYQWENDATSWADGDHHNPLSQQDLKNYIEASTGDIYKDGQLRLIVEEKTAEGVVTVGCLDFYDLDIRNRRVALGIYIDPAVRKRGLATQVMEYAEQYIFDFLHLRILYVITKTNNFASARLFQKRGFQASSILYNWTEEGDAAIWMKFNPEIQ